jgi:hypothetical protein
METVVRLIGNDRRPHRGFLIISHHLKCIPRATSRVAALVAFALAAQGCFNTATPQATEGTYAGAAEYAAYGYSNDPFATYNPFLYGYYCPLAYYYYSYYRGDGDRDCDDGFCGPYGGRRPPHLPLIARSSPPRVPLRENAEAAQRTVATAPSSGPAPSISFHNFSVDGYRGATVPSAGFGSGGFHGGGFGGGGFHESSHR